MWAEFAHLKGSLPAQTLEHDGSDAPQVGLGVVVLRHDDLRSLRTKQQGCVQISLSQRKQRERRSVESWEFRPSD